MKVGMKKDSRALVIATEFIAACACYSGARGQFGLNLSLQRLAVMVGSGV